jgi:hypothetical protein
MSYVFLEGADGSQLTVLEWAKAVNVERGNKKLQVNSNDSYPEA